ncbi:hypothetical protein P152DRAFT_478286 [Eremomyces bilateralis CBS 781.70]|uniref:Uncharacterized protein n=1 Tax=Eremomyces bilateralis CBS 781.70 TaxID=1392243 RepID=A0A6G1GGN6_9PEZI|nr:uncharacterized protein P152DRAFT_478286 [Eremomyces bilateralis CBS 781.70]KAF1817267.1 hypothetical protein P152DRAFT_478286 [Eremomyces bilateralis CBS 781.70]
MKLSTTILALLPLALASPTPQGLSGLLGGDSTSTPSTSGSGSGSGAACTPNAFEKFNLNHHHDINTGDIVTGDSIRRDALKVPGGSGCSPLWAGGAYDDSATFTGGEYPAWLKAELAGAGTGA